MSDWRNTVITALADKPAEWHTLGNVYSKVEDDIPLHHALRIAASKRRSVLRQKGLDDTIQSTDLDVPKATWRLFNTFVLPLVERKGKRNASRTDPVRLKPNGECTECNGPLYLLKFTPGEKNYTCPVCTRPRLVPAAPPPLLLPQPLPKPKPVPKLRLVTPTQAVTKPVPKPPKVRPTPPPQPKKIINPLNQMSTLDQIWTEFKTASHQTLPQFQDNPKMVRQAFRALETGALDEYKRISLFRNSEITALGYPDGFKMSVVWATRSREWIEKTFPTHQKRRWGSLLMEAYGFGALAILSISVSGRLQVVRDELEKVLAQREPPPKPAKQVKHRWLSPIKNAVSRWKIK